MIPRGAGPAARWRLCSPPERAGAIALFQITGDIDNAFRAIGLQHTAVGDVRLRNMGGIDEGLVARPRHDFALLMPHGGTQVVREIAEWLQHAGIARDTADTPRERFPEADSDFEAALLDTLARAASPRAVDLLLDQPARWNAAGSPTPDLATPAPDAAHSRALDHLVSPPLIVAIGPTNIGKSTLLNRLAGRVLAAAADEPGTTRDHVGSLVELDGLVARYIDTAGQREGAGVSEQAAAAIVEPLLSQADLILRLGDARSPAPPPPEQAAAGRDLSSPAIALRADLGTPTWPHTVAVSAVTGAGLDELRVTLRRLLVPDEALSASTPWRFWAAADFDTAQSRP